MLFACLDLTSLTAEDTDEKIIALCQRAGQGSNHVAALCCYPAFLKIAKPCLPANVALATVVNFPSGEAPLSQVLQEIDSALKMGADEIDLVIPYQDVLQGDLASSIVMVKAAKARCGAHLLKVIIESGMLQDPFLIESVSLAVLEAGADFIKTSTGKVPVGATADAVTAILKALVQYREQTGQLKGLKLSGGIKTRAQAEALIQLVEAVFGKAYLQPRTFRIGSSNPDLCC